MKLIAEGRDDLAEKVFATRNIAGNAERFDVLSYDKDGNEKYIEVKTTKGNLDNLFYISENEIAFSEETINNLSPANNGSVGIGKIILPVAPRRIPATNMP